MTPDPELPPSPRVTTLLRAYNLRGSVLAPQPSTTPRQPTRTGERDLGRLTKTRWETLLLGAAMSHWCKGKGRR